LAKRSRARDDFTKKVVRSLRDAVNGRCSKPTCDKPTDGPGSEPGSSHTIGKAAHICAAAPGGPRYDERMSSEERRSYLNGIWLCSCCADDIDKDVPGHPVDLLMAWKRSAEERARERRGKSQPQETDGPRFAALINGVGGTTYSQLAHAIQLVHNSTKRHLENLDPRFAVRSEYQNGKQFLFLEPAADPVNIKITVSGSRLPTYAAQFQTMLEHGEDLSLAVEDVRIDDSPLLRELLRETAGTLTFRPHRLNATVHSEYLQQNGLLLPFEGELTRGATSHSFEGYGCGGLLKLAYQRMEVNQCRMGGFAMTLDLSSWQGKDIRYLSHLHELMNFYQTIHARGYLRSTLSIDGSHAFTFVLQVHDDAKRYFKNLSTFFRYACVCQQIANLLNQSISFTKASVIDESLIHQLDEVHRLLMGEMIERHLASDPLIDVEFESAHDPLLSNDKAPGSARIILTTGETIPLFDIDVPLPQLDLLFTEVVPHVVESQEVAGKTRAKVRLERESGCRCFWSYDRKSEISPIA